MFDSLHNSENICHMPFYFYMCHTESSNMLNNSLLLDSAVYRKLKSALCQKQLVNGIKQASPPVQTSCVEGFHSVLHHFAPKMTSFSYTGMKCRSDSCLLNLMHITTSTSKDNNYF